MAADVSAVRSFNFTNALERSRWLQVRSWGGLPRPSCSKWCLTLISSGEIQNFGGVLVGGAVGIWFFVAGITWLVDYLSSAVAQSAIAI